jgi:hypothetical protein
MDVQHEKGGSMEILLNPRNTNDLLTRGFCTGDRGTAGNRVGIFIFTNKLTEEPRAIIDPAGDLHLYLPTVSSPDIDLTIPHDRIEASQAPKQATVDYYLGPAGSIVLRSEVSVS